MKTTIHTYRFDVSKPAEAAAHAALWEALKAKGLSCFNVYADAKRSPLESPELDGQTIELETAHLFANQWNTGPMLSSATGYRVFDWYEGIYRNQYIKAGHWLEQTDEMKSIRLHTLKCGYCGHYKPDTSGLVFCPDCLDSEFLKEADLKLLRLRPVSDDSHNFPELSEAEAADLLPKYTEAQIHGSTERGKRRIAAKRAKVLADADKDIANALTERDGFIWCMDRGINTENLIFYKHTSKFSFGWRSPITSEAVYDALVASLEGFPFPYEIKRTA